MIFEFVLSDLVVALGDDHGEDALPGERHGEARVQFNRHIGFWVGFWDKLRTFRGTTSVGTTSIQSVCHAWLQG